MVTFRNNNNVRRNNFRRNDRGFKSNTDRPKYGSNFSKSENFQRKSPGRNNHGQKNIDNISELGVTHLDVKINPNIERKLIFRSFTEKGE